VLAASVGAVFGIGGNIAMEFIKPKIAKGALKREVSAQLVREIKRNLKHMKDAREVIQATKDGAPMKKEHALYLL
jgi:hypothetical protein